MGYDCNFRSIILYWASIICDASARPLRPALGEFEDWIASYNATVIYYPIAVPGTYKRMKLIRFDSEEDMVVFRLKTGVVIDLKT